jgi:hypothetical protein
MQAEKKVNARGKRMKLSRGRYSIRAMQMSKQVMTGITPQ